MAVIDPQPITGRQNFTLVQIEINYRRDLKLKVNAI